MIPVTNTMYAVNTNSTIVHPGWEEKNQFCGVFNARIVFLIISILTILIGIGFAAQGYQIGAWVGIIAGICGLIGVNKQKRAYLKVYRNLMIFHAIVNIIGIIIMSSTRDVIDGFSWTNSSAMLKSIIIQSYVCVAIDMYFAYLCTGIIEMVTTEKNAKIANKGAEIIRQQNLQFQNAASMTHNCYTQPQMVPVMQVPVQPMNVNPVHAAQTNGIAGQEGYC